SRWHLLRGIELKEHRFQGLDQGNVQPVHPDDTILRLIAVIMPGPTLSQYEISGLHIDALAIDGGISVTPFNNEADRRRAVPVSAGHLTRQKHLYCCDKIVCRRPATVESGVEKLQCPALLTHRHRRARLIDDRLESGPGPHIRDHFGLWMTRHLTRQFPKAVHMVRVHALVKRRPHLLD